MCYLLKTLVVVWSHSSSELPVLKDFWDVRVLSLGFLAVLHSRLLSGYTDKWTHLCVQLTLHLRLSDANCLSEENKAVITCTLK